MVQVPHARGTSDEVGEAGGAQVMQDFQDIHGSSTFVPKEEEAIGSLRRGTVSCDTCLERSGWVPSGEYSVGV